MAIDNFRKSGDDGVQTPAEILESVTHKVEALLRQEFPDYLKFSTGTFTISRGSTQVMITVRPFNQTDCAVECSSNLVTGCNITPEVMQWLLRKNAELHYGGFGLLFDGTIVFTHSISGVNLDANELSNSVTAVAIIADYYDDEIVQMAGGRRFRDTVSQDLEEQPC